jgi:hypothetical protein
LTNKILFYWQEGSWWSYRKWIYNCLCNQCLSPLKFWIRWRGVLDTTLCDKVWQWLVAGQWHQGMFNELRWEVIVCFADIGDHHCLNFLFIMTNLQQLFYFLFHTWIIKTVYQKKNIVGNLHFLDCTIKIYPQTISGFVSI